MSREGLVIEKAVLSEGDADLRSLAGTPAASKAPQAAEAAGKPAPEAPSQTYLERVKGLFSEPFIRSLPVVRLPFDAQLLSLRLSRLRLKGIPALSSSASGSMLRLSISSFQGALIWTKHGHSAFL